jgi:hypothetical protein
MFHFLEDVNLRRREQESCSFGLPRHEAEILFKELRDHEGYDSMDL